MTASDLLQTAAADLERVRDLLQRYANKTDTPPLGVVEAADLVDAARDALNGVE